MTLKKSKSKGGMRKRKMFRTRGRNILSNRKFITDTARIRSVVLADIGITSGTDTAANYYFQPDQCVDFNTYLSLYEQWRLHHVIIKWIPSVSETNQGFLQKNIAGFRWNPNNNITGIPTFTEMRQASNTKFQRVTQGYTKTLYPVAKRQVGYAGITTYYEDVPCQKIWMQCTNGGASSIIFYGFDWYFQDMGITAQIGSFEIEYFLEFKGQK